MRAKVIQLSVAIPPNLKEWIWKEASRLHMTPSVWVRIHLRESLERSKTIQAPDQYVITLTQKQAIGLRKQGFRIEHHPIED